MMYEKAVGDAPSRWEDVEDSFLSAMWAFDQNFIHGVANQGDNQNGKGDFFTDLVILLLENCSRKRFYGRGRVPGLIFQRHALDATYPREGTIEVLIETKVAGAPKTSRNPQQKNPKGRDGSADLDKRIKEAGLKTIDLKAEWARNAGRGGGPAGDLVAWLKESKPKCFLFLAVRLVDQSDFKRTVQVADAANQMMDGVGVYLYGASAKEDRYESLRTPTHLQIGRVLYRVCTTLRALQ
jgi:hypothetical protein